MQIKGFLETSLTDYEGKVASMIFLPGCNFRCSFCFNADLVLYPEKLETIPFEAVKTWLIKNKKFVDAVVIGGGEPTMHKDLPELFKEIKRLGFLTKLDTNGTNPYMLKKLIEKGLVDAVAMDIKTCLNQEKYGKVVNAEVRLDKIKESISIIINSGIDHEFRTTLIPKLHSKGDVVEIAKKIKGAKRYVLQKFRPSDTLIDKKFEKEAPYSNEEMRSISEECSKYVATKVRG
jgi:pyruvate formate lyase activating enzyme